MADTTRRSAQCQSRAAEREPRRRRENARTPSPRARWPIAGRSIEARGHRQLQLGREAPSRAPRSPARTRWTSWSPPSSPISTASPSSQFIVKPVEGLINSLIGSLLPIGGRARRRRPGERGRALSRRRAGPGTVRAAAIGRHRAQCERAPQRPQIVMNVQAARCAELPEIRTPARRDDVARPGARAAEFVNHRRPRARVDRA